MNARLKDIAAGVVVSALAVALGGSQAAIPSKKPIVIGVTVDLTGFAQGAGVPTAKAIDVWAKWINDKGGLAGHPVTLVTRDAKSDPATGAAMLKELLADPKITVVVHESNDTGASDLVAKAAMPVISGMWDNEMATNPNVFPAATTDQWISEAVATVGVKSNIKHPKGGLLYVPPNAEPVADMRAGAKKAGGDLVYVQEVAHDASGDFAPLCRAAKAKDVGWIWILHYPATVAKIAEDCAKIGYRPTWLVTFPTDDELKVPALDGMKVVMPNMFFTAPSPAAEEFRQAVAKYDPDYFKSPFFGQPSIMAWTAMQLLAKAVEKAEPKGTEITREDIYRGLYSLKDETLNGLAPPLTFVRGKAATISCYFTAEVKSGKLLPVSDEPSC